MSALGPFSSAELASLKLHAELDSASDPRAMVLLRLIRMLEARDNVIRELTKQLSQLLGQS